MGLAPDVSRITRARGICRASIAMSAPSGIKCDNSAGFQAHWMPAWEAEKEVGSHSTETHPAGHYRSGREKLKWVAYGRKTHPGTERPIKAERDAMKLISKNGNEYIIVSRYPLGVWGNEAR